MTMLKQFIRAASSDRSRGLFVGSLVLFGVFLMTRSSTMLIISACLFAGGVMVMLSQWASEPDETPERPSIPLAKDISQSLRDEMLSLRSLQVRAAAINQEKIVREIDAMGSIARRLEALGEIDPADIQQKVKDIYSGSFQSLGRAVELARAQQQMTTPDVRARVHMAREKLVADVGESLRLLERTVDELQASKLDPDAATRSLAQLRGELDQSLELAKRVDQRMRDLESDEDQQYSRTNA